MVGYGIREERHSDPSPPMAQTPQMVEAPVLEARAAGWKERGPRSLKDSKLRASVGYRQYREADRGMGDSAMKWSFVALAIVAASAAPVWAQTSTFTDPGRAFSLDLPDGCTVTSRPNLPDFNVYDVMCHGVGYAGIYVGRFPQSDPNARIFSVGSLRVQVWADPVPTDQMLADRIAASVKPVQP